MKRHHLLAVLSATLIAGVGTATPASAAALSPTDRCIADADALGLYYGPDVQTVIAGTQGNDDFRGRTTPDGLELICGFGGNDRASALSEGDVFLGGAGNDRLDPAPVPANGIPHDLADAFFIGGAGDDVIGGGGAITGSFDFDGGPGNDSLVGKTYMAGESVFDGGPGDDHAGDILDSARFLGGPGDDSATGVGGSGYANGAAGDDHFGYLLSGTIEGGDGKDVVDQMSYVSGKFYGQGGDDKVKLLEAGRFAGGAGNDSVVKQTGGTFTQ